MEDSPTLALQAGPAIDDASAPGLEPEGRVGGPADNDDDDDDEDDEDDDDNSGCGEVYTTRLRRVCLATVLAEVSRVSKQFK